jgi:hypothetical protein
MLTKGTYQKLIASYRGTNIVLDIPSTLVPLWCDDYYSDNPGGDLVSVDLKESGAALTYLFDIRLERTIVAYGVPIFAGGKRDAGRMAGHPNSAGPTFHRGHLIAHSIGGGTDINLVPQLGKLNIGEFRVLERRVRDLARQNANCLYFIRPIYKDKSQIPSMFEQGAILASKSLLYALHMNS